MKQPYFFEWLIPFFMLAAPVGMEFAEIFGDDEDGGESVSAAKAGTLYSSEDMKEAGVPELDEEGSLKVHVIDVGQGDGIAIECPNGDVGMVIDSADNRDSKGLNHFKAYINELMNQDSDGRIEMVLATHPHSDHIGGTQWLLESFGVLTYVDNGQKHKSKTYEHLMTALETAIQDGTRYVSVGGPGASDPGNKQIGICGEDEVYIEFLVPVGGYTGCSNPNECSVVTRLDYRETSYLFVGDAEGKEEDHLLADPYVHERLNVDVLKAGHHGSDTSSTIEFLYAVSPSYILVSVGTEGVGTNKGYMHPRLSTIEAFNQVIHSVVPEAEWREKTARSYNAEEELWVDTRIREGLWLTALDGVLLVSTDGGLSVAAYLS